MKKRRKVKKRKIHTKVLSVIGIAIIFLFCIFIYRQNNLPKTQVVQVSASNGQADSNESDNNLEENELNDSKSTNNENTNPNKNEVEDDKNSFDAGKIQDFLSKNIKIDDGKKIAFLTFDDGPSTTVTPEILNILKQNDIKGTFFIVGNQVEENQEAKNILLDIYKQGHAIANHTYTHKYSKLYPGSTVDSNAFMEEIEKTNTILRDVLGQNFKTRVVRFPGGHASWKGREEIDSKLEAGGYKYIDWNSLIGDAEGGTKSREQLINRYNQTFVGQEKAIILMHDTYGKKSTADALQHIIDDLKNKGYEFKTLK